MTETTAISMLAHLFTGDDKWNCQHVQIHSLSCVPVPADDTWFVHLHVDSARRGWMSKHLHCTFSYFLQDWCCLNAQTLHGIYVSLPSYLHSSMVKVCTFLSWSTHVPGINFVLYIVSRNMNTTHIGLYCIQMYIYMFVYNDI